MIFNKLTKFSSCLQRARKYLHIFSFFLFSAMFFLLYLLWLIYRYFLYLFHSPSFQSLCLRKVVQKDGQYIHANVYSLIQMEFFVTLRLRWMVQPDLCLVPIQLMQGLKGTISGREREREKEREREREREIKKERKMDSCFYGGEMEGKFFCFVEL